MEAKKTKFSLVIPARNGGHYLKECVDTILSQDGDFELIVSDDNSTDGSQDYLKSLQDPRLKVYFPEPGMSMAEHWEWALEKAHGEWLMFVGQDDGIQGYFFALANVLTDLASQKNIRAIMSQRAYYFWPGCQFMYGDIALSFSARNAIVTKNSKLEALWALLGFQPYFELPEMYTTSLFHCTLIDEAKRKQNGKLFLAHPQDANLGAIACSLEPKYLHSYIPLGWVGTSPKSAGMAIGASYVEDESKKSLVVDEVRKDYLRKTSESKIAYNWLAGDFSIASSALYFWGALLQTPMNYSQKLSRVINSHIFKTVMLAGVWAEVKSSSRTNQDLRMHFLTDAIDRNGCSIRIISFLSRFHKLAFVVWKFLRVLSKFVSVVLRRNVKVEQPGSEKAWPSLLKSSHLIAEDVIRSRLIQNL